jgi:Tol biopolymer transport system component
MNGLGIYRYDFADKSLSPVIASKFREVSPTVSKYGRYILYMSDESGRNEIYVSELGGDHGRWQVSNDGGFAPTWRADNKEIYFYSGSDLMAVDVTISESGFQIGQPNKLFTKPLNFSGVTSASRYAPSKDGQKFLLNVPLVARSNDNLIIVQNWLAEMEKK